MLLRNSRSRRICLARSNAWNAERCSGVPDSPSFPLVGWSFAIQSSPPPMILLARDLPLFGERKHAGPPARGLRPDRLNQPERLDFSPKARRLSMSWDG